MGVLHGHGERNLEFTWALGLALLKQNKAELNSDLTLGLKEL